MLRFQNFLISIQQDIKAFLLWCLLFTVFRAVFIAIYASQLTGGMEDVLTAMFLGLRLSLKTAGWISMVGFILATLPKVVVCKWPEAKIRWMWHSFALLFFSICFYARIPYYRIFNSGFNMMLINGVHDDIYATFITAVREYQLLVRLPLAIVTGLLLAYILKRILAKGVLIDHIPAGKGVLYAVGTVIFIPVLCVFVRYGGAFRYDDSINWESAARTNSNLLNEAILDDGQALYRVYHMKKKLHKVTNVNISPAKMRDYIALAGGRKDDATITDAFMRQVAQPKLAVQPKNIVVVTGESFGLWPMLPKFQNLGLYNETLRLSKDVHSVSVGNMLSGGDGTISAVNALLTGLPASGLFENYQPQSFKGPYQTGIGYIMKQLGYKTVFWYGGFPGWQDLEKFASAQCFDEVHCADEFGKNDGNAWGVHDEVLFAQVEEYMAKQGDAKVFHLILTTSNHPPYSVDVEKAGFPKAAVASKLPADIDNNEQMLKELGHLWYADKTVGAFVRIAEKTIPATLFVITGDHSERFSFAKEQDKKTTSALPCIFYGSMIAKQALGNLTVGCHMQLAGTLAEMVAPAGFTYSSLLPSMFAHVDVYNHKLYADKENIGMLSEREDFGKVVAAQRKVAAWRVLKGDKIQ